MKVETNQVSEKQQKNRKTTHNNYNETKRNNITTIDIREANKSTFETKISSIQAKK